MELILNFAAPFRRHPKQGVVVRQPHRMLVGQMERPVSIEPTGRVELLGIRFHPAGAYPFLRIPMHEFTGGMFPLDEVSGDLEDSISTCVCPERTTRKKIAAVEAILVQRLSEITDHHAGVEAAVGTILAREGAIRVVELAQGIGLNHRQLQRKFLERVGIPPKLLARLIRFQRVFRAVESNHLNWAAVAVACGYYDSAHLIKDFHEFSGRTPTALFEQEAWLTHLFTRKDRVSLSYKTGY
jgi:AraC-like DNA-binding protein